LVPCRWREGTILRWEGKKGNAKSQKNQSKIKHSQHRACQLLLHPTAALGSKVGAGMGSERLLLAALGGETTKAGFWPWFRGLLRCRFREGSFGLLGKAYLGRQVNLMERLLPVLFLKSLEFSSEKKMILNFFLNTQDFLKPCLLNLNQTSEKHTNNWENFNFAHVVPTMNHGL
jgi:hypothetical protein